MRTNDDFIFAFTFNYDNVWEWSVCIIILHVSTIVWVGTNNIAIFAKWL